MLTEITEYERFLLICDDCDRAEAQYEALQSTTNIDFLKKKLKKTISSLDDKDSEKNIIARK